MKTLNAFLKGILAGFLIALGGIANLACICKGGSGIGNLFGAMFFSIGLLCVCFLGANLYTGKIGFIIEERKIRFCIDTFIGLLGNVIGALLVGLLISLLGKDNFINSVDLSLVNGKIENFDILKTIISSAFCGILIYLGVYLFKKYENPGLKTLFIFLAVTVFVISGFDHCVANVFYFTDFALINGFNIKLVYLFLLNVLGNSLGSLLLYGIIKAIDVVQVKVNKSV
jgi:formate/nitrite transporter FocA (FNT family)